VIGGGEIYSQTINIVEKIELTRVFKDYEGDAYFPDVPLDKFKLVSEEAYELKGVENIKYSFLTYIKK
jgi:dihydrofolate reductase